MELLKDIKRKSSSVLLIASILSGCVQPIEPTSNENSNRTPSPRNLAVAINLCNRINQGIQSGRVQLVGAGQNIAPQYLDGLLPATLEELGIELSSEEISQIYHALPNVDLALTGEFDTNLCEETVVDALEG